MYPLLHALLTIVCLISQYYGKAQPKNVLPEAKQVPATVKEFFKLSTYDNCNTSSLTIKLACFT